MPRPQERALPKGRADPKREGISGHQVLEPQGLQVKTTFLKKKHRTESRGASLGMNAEEGVGQTLFLNGGCRAVAGVHPKVVTEGEDFCPNPFDQSGMITTMEIGPPHRTGKERVPGEYGAVRVKTHPAGRMSRGVDYRDGIGAQVDPLRFFEISIRFEVQRRSIQLMDQDGRFCNPSYLLSGAGVIEMAVRDEDIPDLQTAF